MPEPERSTGGVTRLGVGHAGLEIGVGFTKCAFTQYSHSLCDTVITLFAV